MSSARTPAGRPTAALGCSLTRMFVIEIADTASLEDINARRIILAVGKSRKEIEAIVQEDKAKDIHKRIESF